MSVFKPVQLMRFLVAFTCLLGVCSSAESTLTGGALVQSGASAGSPLEAEGKPVKTTPAEDSPSQNETLSPIPAGKSSPDPSPPTRFDEDLTG